MGRGLGGLRPWSAAALCLAFGAALAGGWVTLPSDYAKWEGRRYAWPISDHPLGDEGLSGGLAFAIDPAFCARLRPVFREDRPGDGSLNLYRFITCADINDALARAMTTWSSNHPYVKFYNVSDECAAEGRGRDCSIAEVYIEAASPSPSAGMDSLAAYVVHNPSWRRGYANGERWEAGVRMTNGDDSPRDWQLKFASITFHDHLCFYLDSSFCSALRAHNDRFGNVALVGSAVTFSLWASSFLFLLLRTVRFAWLAARNGLLAGLSRSATEASRWMALNYVCVFFIISPPIFWYKMFLPCIECYDFEATAAHELGHVLGFSHPDIHPAAHHVARRPPSAANCCRRSSAPAGAAYSWMDAANCSSGALQTDAVAFDANDPAISSSIMYHLTTFKSRACLSLNDLHGLLHQYPVCDDALIHQTEPLCVKAKRNIGWARALEAILPPVVFASLVLFITVSLASRIQRQQTSRELWSLAARTALDGSTGPRPREHAAKTPAAGRGLATLGTNDAPTSGARSHASRRDALSSSISTPTHGPHTPLVDAASQAAAVAAAAALTPAPCREPPALEAAHLAQVPPQELMHRTPPSKRLSTGAATRELVARAASQRQARARKLPEPTAGSPAPTQAQSDVLEKWRIYREQSRSARADGGVAHVPPLALRPHPDFLGLRSSVASDGLPRGGAPSAAGGSGSVQPMASSKGTAHAPGRASEEAQLYA